MAALSAASEQPSDRLVGRPAGTVPGAPAQMGWIEYLPPSYRPDGTTPMLIFLGNHHGDAASIAEELGNAYGTPIGMIRENNWPLDRNLAVLQPAMPVGTQISAHELFQIFITFALQYYNLDPHCVTLGGHSWSASAAQDYYKAYAGDPLANQVSAIFTSGCSNYSAWPCQGPNLANVNIWNFSGSYDGGVISNPVMDRSMSSAMTSMRSPPRLGDARFTVLPNVEHSTMCYPLVINDTGHDIYGWMMSKRRLLPGESIPAAGMLMFSDPVQTGYEGDSGTSTHLFHVARTRGSRGAVSVHYATVDVPHARARDATHDDYVPIEGTLTWADGDTSERTIALSIVGDQLPEYEEVVHLNLDTPTGGAMLGTSTAEFTIINDDNPSGLIYFIDGDLAVPEGNSGVTTHRLRVGRRIGSSGTVSMHYTINRGTYDYGLYLATHVDEPDALEGDGTLTWGDGDTSERVIEVNVIGDTRAEPDESLAILLDPPTGGASIDANASWRSLIILNDDGPCPLLIYPLPGTGHPMDYTTAAGASASFQVMTWLRCDAMYQWESAAPNSDSFAPIPGATESNYTISSAAPDLNGRRYRCVLTNAAGSVTSNPAVLTVTGTANPPPNAPPTVQAGADQTIQLPISSVALAGSASDSDGTVVAYAWSEASGGPTTIESPTSAATRISGLAVGSYVFRLTATDDRGATASADVGVTVQAAAVTPPDPPAIIGVQLGAVTHAPNFLGGSNAAEEEIFAVATDASGNAYMGGWTAGSIADGNAGPDALVAKVSPAGAVQWVLQLGTTVRVPGAPADANAGNDFVTGLAVDSAGNIYCSGYTSGAVAEPSAGGYNGFLLKLSPAGSILWGRQLGAATAGPSGSTGNSTLFMAVAVDGAGNPYVVGNGSGNICEPGGGGSDVFVLKYSPDGAILGGRQLGAVSRAPGAPDNANQGNDYSGAQKGGIAIGPSGTIVVSGFTDGAIGEPNAGSSDACVVAFNPDLSIAWARQFGASTRAPGAPAGANRSLDRFNDVAIDASGNVYATGSTDEVMAEANAGNMDIVTAKLSPSGEVLWVTQLGALTRPPGGSTAEGDFALGLVADGLGGAICVGSTGSGHFAEPRADKYDGFVVHFGPSGALVSATQFGAITHAAGAPPNANADFDMFYDIAMGPGGRIVLAGYTLGSIAEINGGANDAFLLMLGGSGGPGNAAPTVQAGPNQTIQLPTSSVMLAGSASDSDGTVVAYAWSKVAGGAATIESPTSAATRISGLSLGSYVFRLTATDDRGATASADVGVTVVVATENQPPVVSAGSDVSIVLPTNAVTLAGSASDPDGAIASVSWTQLSGVAATITSRGMVSTLVTGLGAGTSVFRLSATDNLGATSFATVTVTVASAGGTTTGGGTTGGTTTGGGTTGGTTTGGGTTGSTSSGGGSHHGGCGAGSGGGVAIAALALGLHARRGARRR